MKKMSVLFVLFASACSSFGGTPSPTPDLEALVNEAISSIRQTEAVLATVVAGSLVSAEGTPSAPLDGPLQPTLSPEEYARLFEENFNRKVKNALPDVQTLTLDNPDTEPTRIEAHTGASSNDIAKIAYGILKIYGDMILPSANDSPENLAALQAETFEITVFSVNDVVSFFSITDYQTLRLMNTLQITVNQWIQRSNGVYNR